MLERLALGMLIALAAIHAFAHALVASSQPAPQATVPRGELRIALRFNSRIDAGRSRISLQAPDNVRRDVRVAPDASRAGLVGTFDVERAGDWVLRWEVLSVDGHVTRGEIPFTVKDRQAGT